MMERREFSGERHMKKANIPLLRLEYTDKDITFLQHGIREILLSGYLTMADKVKQFEHGFSRWIGCRYALGTSSGTSSLEIVLRAIGVEEKTVICPSNTFMATATAAIHAGATVAFVDSQIENLQMDPKSLERALREIDDIAAVVIVHIGGIISPHLWEIRGLCDGYGIPLIEDAAHAHGATIDGKYAGTLGLAGSFSFYPTKVLVTGEGGMVTTDDPDIYEKGVVLREHGKADHRYNVHTEFGYNWRFSEFHALLGIQQLRIADQILDERRKIAKWYDELVEGVPGVTRIEIPSNMQSSYYKYICYLDEKIDRGGLKEKLLREFGVSLTGEVYSDPCHSQPVFKKYPSKVISLENESFENTDYICNRHVCLPLYPGLQREEIEYVVESIRKCVSSL
jgi:perosamine synthetase